MAINADRLCALKNEAERHLTTKLLPFWLSRCKDEKYGGFITHFDSGGQDTGVDEKSLISQARTIYTMASAHRAGYGGGACARYAAHGVRFLIDKYWDKIHGGFYWMANRRGDITIDKKILYGQSFAIYALSEYALATGDKEAMNYAMKTFALVRLYCLDRQRGGYLEMFERNWRLRGAGAAGGDRKTLDAHMHLMEAFTTLSEMSSDDEHRKALTEVIDLLTTRFLHPQSGTGIAQFTDDWQVAPQIKFDIVWGQDRFPDAGVKIRAKDNTSYGHNAELAWLMIHALRVLGETIDERREAIRKLLNHTVEYGIDQRCGGVFVEGPHEGPAHDQEKEFWQQAEVLVAMLDACIIFGDDKYLDAYENVHRFVFDKVIDHNLGEWRPLLTREGKPIWTHLGHSWKTNYHTVRSMIQCIKKMAEFCTPGREGEK